MFIKNDNQMPQLSKEIHSLYCNNIYSSWSFIIDLAYYYSRMFNKTKVNILLIYFIIFR